MNKIFGLSLLLCLTISTGICQPSEEISPNEYILKDYQKKWEANKRYTLELLEAMPSELYSYVPVEGMRSYSDQAVHIHDVMSFKMGKLGYKNGNKIKAENKETIISSYQELFDGILQHLSSMDADKLGETQKLWYGQSTQIRLLNLMDNHLAHHRGQMIVYLRLKGIKPPAYVGW